MACPGLLGALDGARWPDSSISIQSLYTGRGLLTKGRPQYSHMQT